MAARTLKVEVESDFLGKVSNASAYVAISELIWNALDADANKVSVKLNEDALYGGLKNIEVTDDGFGITEDIADKHFSKLGGSWKKFKNKTLSGRFLHGQEGQGRFKPFSLGKVIDWETVYFDEQEGISKSFSITGIMEWTHPLLIGLAMGHDVVAKTHQKEDGSTYEDYYNRFRYRKVCFSCCWRR